MAASRAERLFALSHDLLGAAAPDGRLMWVNPAWEELLGWTEAELLTVPYLELIHPDDRPAAALLADELVRRRAGERPEIELRARTSDGGHRWILFSLAQAPDEPAVYLCGKDLTDREVARRELAQAEARFTEAFENAAVGLALVSPDGALLRTNRALSDLTGWPGSALLERDLAALTHPEDRSMGAEAVAALRAGHGGPLAHERRFVRSDETEILVRINLALIHDADGAPQHFVAQIEDVTERQEMIEALALSQARYRELVANLPESIIGLFDHDLRLLIVEGAQLARRGLHPSQFEGKRLRDVIPSALVELGESRCRAALAGESTGFEVVTPDGSVIYWVQALPLRGEDGEVIGGLGLMRDITARRRAELSLEERTRDLERSNADLERFAYVASHDLSEPLRTVSGYLQLLTRRYGDRLEGQPRELVERAVAGTAHMQALIDDMLAYSRAGRSERPLVPVALGPLVERTVDVLGAREAVTSDGLPTVLGDPLALGQLFQNLIGNGLKFVPPGGSARVEVTAERTGDEWRISVTDDGIGLDPQDAGRVFRMFGRLDAADEYPGTGIGLAIVRKVVERHGGRIWIETPEGGGTRFCLTLPAA